MRVGRYHSPHRVVNLHHSVCNHSSAMQAYQCPPSHQPTFYASTLPYQQPPVYTSPTYNQYFLPTQQTFVPSPPSPELSMPDFGVIKTGIAEALLKYPDNTSNITLIESNLSESQHCERWLKGALKVHFPNYRADSLIALIGLTGSNNNTRILIDVPFFDNVAPFCQLHPQFVGNGYSWTYTKKDAKPVLKFSNATIRKNTTQAASSCTQFSLYIALFNATSCTVDSIALTAPFSLQAHSKTQTTDCYFPKDKNTLKKQLTNNKRTEDLVKVLISYNAYMPIDPAFLATALNTFFNVVSVSCNEANLSTLLNCFGPLPAVAYNVCLLTGTHKNGIPYYIGTKVDEVVFFGFDNVADLSKPLAVIANSDVEKGLFKIYKLNSTLKGLELVKVKLERIQNRLSDNYGFMIDTATVIPDIAGVMGYLLENYSPVWFPAITVQYM